ncbi:MAG TPA: thiopeptide maturation pyridine synthase [Ktedonobacteraceae bacterium]|nr:thiopeptide maturation pyridine synthase [Ktedonobacteraceae bacterium]
MEQWFSIHIYYYDEQKDRLILDCVQPLFRSVQQRCASLFFVRHWAQGPHLRLRFLCSPDQFAHDIRPLAEKEIQSYLKEHPSRTVLNEDQLRPVYENLARQEVERGPILPLLPDNSLHTFPYDRRLHVLKSSRLAGLLEDFYCQTNDLTFEMLAYIHQGHSLLTLSLDLLYTTAHLFKSIPITDGYLSYRSHADAFIIGCAQPQAIRALFEQKYTAQAAALTQRLPHLLDALQQKIARFPFTLSWSQVMQGFWERCFPLLQSGQIDGMPSLEGNDGTRPTFTGQAREHLTQSAFHLQLERNTEYRDALYADTRFQCYRLMLNMLYLHLSRLGVRAIDRFMLCYIAANTVEEVFHVNAVARFAGDIQQFMRTREGS